jgi:hypothetical protein
MLICAENPIKRLSIQVTDREYSCLEEGSAAEEGSGTVE